jgi:hypothetical protein
VGDRKERLVRVLAMADLARHDACALVIAMKSVAEPTQDPRQEGDSGQRREDAMTKKRSTGPNARPKNETIAGAGEGLPDDSGRLPEDVTDADEESARKSLDDLGRGKGEGWNRTGKRSKQ